MVFHQLSHKLWFVLSTSYMIAIYCTSWWYFLLCDFETFYSFPTFNTAADRKFKKTDYFSFLAQSRRMSAIILNRINDLVRCKWVNSFGTNVLKWFSSICLKRRSLCILSEINCRMLNRHHIANEKWIRIFHDGVVNTGLLLHSPIFSGLFA